MQSILKAIQRSCKASCGLKNFKPGGFVATMSQRSNSKSSEPQNHPGLMEFFDDPKNWGESSVKSGRPWRMEELRLKSSSDLHKLWFVLYKERNMLYTMREAANEELEPFPSPERLDKVEISMANLEKVVMERNKAFWQLEVSPCLDGMRPRAFRRDVFGRPRWHQLSQHLPPYHMNFNFRQTQGVGPNSETNTFFRRYREMQRSRFNGARGRTARYLRDLFRRFPDADADYIAELHPELPAGYVKHLKENHHLYIHDPPRRPENLSTAKRQLEEKQHRLLE